MARIPFRLGVQNCGAASQLTGNKQPPWALLNSIFSNQINVALLILICLHFLHIKNCNFVVKGNFCILKGKQ